MRHLTSSISRTSIVNWQNVASKKKSPFYRNRKYGNFMFENKMTKISFQKCMYTHLHLFREIWHLDVYLSHFLWQCLSLVVLVLSMYILLLWFSKFCKVFFCFGCQLQNVTQHHILKLKNSVQLAKFLDYILATDERTKIFARSLYKYQEERWIYCIGLSIILCTYC